jgi:hypothetical protein
VRRGKKGWGIKLRPFVFAVKIEGLKPYQEKSMKKLFSVLAAIVLLTGLAFPQMSPQGAMRGGKYSAVDYNYGGTSAPGLGVSWATVTTGNTTAGASGTLTVAYGNITMANGRTVMPFSVNAPVLIDSGGNQETQTPTVVSCGTPQMTNTCTLSFTTLTNVHGSGTRIASGTGGLQEALNDAFQQGGGIVGVDQAWVKYGGGTAAMIAAAAPYSNVVIEDFRASSGVQYYAARPTATTTLAAGAVPTFTKTTGASTYYIKYVYVDLNGQLGPSSTQTAQLTSATTPITVNAPVASTGAVGWIPFITAAGGGTNTEIMVPVTSSVCTLTLLSPIPACAVPNTTYGQAGSAAVISTIPSGTAFAFGNSGLTAANDTGFNGRTTMGYVPVPASTAFLPFSPVIVGGGATKAASNATYEVGSWNLPSGFFNVLGRKYNFCASGHMVSAANSETLNLNLAYGPYDNSDTVLWTITTTAYSTTNTSAFHTCVEITTVSTGATGTLSAHGVFITNLAAGATLTTLTEFSNATNAITGLSSSLDLTQQGQLRLEAVIGAGAFGTGGVVFDEISLVPLN